MPLIWKLLGGPELENREPLVEVLPVATSRLNMDRMKMR